MQKSKIEYLTHVWNFYTGCKHWENGKCPVGEKCWAKAMDKRFGRSFEPTLNLKVLNDRLTMREPARIGVCFTGDLFGDWVNPEEIVRAPFHHWNMMPLREMVINIVKSRPQHQFFFLTKAPENYQKWGEWPDNAWLGATVNYAAPMGMALTYFAETKAKHKWLSIEPLMGEIKIGNLRGVDWIVIGGWSGRSKVQPKVEWVREIVTATDKAGIPVFLKDNLKFALPAEKPFMANPEMKLELRQELPK
jgi:protein gp37